MFCYKCGKEINEEALFCTYCGTSIHEGIAAKRIENSNVKRGKKWIVLFIIITVVVIVIAFPVRFTVEKTIVKSVAENYLQKIKDGPSAETIDEMIVQLLYEATESKTITSLIHSKIKGQDLKDIYDSLMLHYSYKVTEVERISSDHYRITVHIENMNNALVASQAWSDYKGKYDDCGLVDGTNQLMEDLKGDISIHIAGHIEEASDDLFRLNYAGNSTAGTYVIDVEKKDDDWIPRFEDGVASFIFDCAGIPISGVDLDMLNSIIEDYDTAGDE